MKLIIFWTQFNVRCLLQPTDKKHKDGRNSDTLFKLDPSCFSDSISSHKPLGQILLNLTINSYWLYTHN